ncbi:MAG: hypothetical protein ACTSXQ_03885 [Alphaproteobacteria bacterium]
MKKILLSLFAATLLVWGSADANAYGTGNLQPDLNIGVQSIAGPADTSDFTMGAVPADYTLMNVATARLDTLHTTLRQITYVLAGVGLIALVILAAVGKWEWKWFFMLCGGLFLLAGFQALINFLN